MSTITAEEFTAEVAPQPIGLRLYLEGGWQDTSRHLPLISPVTGQEIAQVPVPTREDVTRAARSARRAQADWAEVGSFQRAEICHRIGAALERRAEPLARLQSLEQGKPLTESLADVREAAKLFHLHAEDQVRLGGETLPVTDARKRMLTFRRPVGVWAIITPWNFPVLMMAEFVAPGLAGGNALVVKPPAHTCAAVLGAVAAFQEAGLASGLVSILPGGAEVGELLVREPRFDAIGFIGSSATGAKIQAMAGLRRSIMECSGNGPLIVCADADLARAARAATYGAYLCSGQVCCATERVLVHHSVHQEFLDRCLDEASLVHLGDPFDPRVNLGPLNNQDVAAKMDRHLADAVRQGARVLTGGGRRSGMPTDLYYEFSLVDQVTPGMAAFQEESFGPILPITTARDDQQLLELANQDRLGLQAAVFTRDLARAFHFAERLQVGQVIVNDTTDYWDINMPFGGAGGRQSGWGRIGGKWTVMDMTDVRTAVIDLS
ncbi:MAG: aldehyde dehydrogenase family protein [Candidatus Dormibacteria bacterium]